MPITVMLWYETEWWLYFISVFNFQSFFFSLFLFAVFRLAAVCLCLISWAHTHQALDDYEIEEDLPNAMKLLGEMNNNVKQVSDLVESMLQRVKSGELTTEYGLSFLEVRYHMLLTYLINLTYVVLRKCSGTIFNIRNRFRTRKKKPHFFHASNNKTIDQFEMFNFHFKSNAGKSIERDPSIDRLIEIRTVLEKIRPIDYKLRYQIDKLVKTAITGVTNSKDPINFKVQL